MFNGRNHGPDTIFCQNPAVMGKTANQLEFQALIHLLGGLVISQNVSGQRQGKLRRSTAAVTPFKPARRMIAQIMSRIERATFAVLVDDDGGTVFRSCALVELHVRVG